MSSTRLQSLDVLRGIAILGTLGTNIWIFTDPEGLIGYLQGPSASPWRPVEITLQVLAQGKFLGLLTIMFGIGLALQQRSVLNGGGHWPGSYPWRALLLPDRRDRPLRVVHRVRRPDRLRHHRLDRVLSVGHRAAYSAPDHRGRRGRAPGVAHRDHRRPAEHARRRRITTTAGPESVCGRIFLGSGRFPAGSRAALPPGDAADLPDVDRAVPVGRQALPCRRIGSARGGTASAADLAGVRSRRAAGHRVGGRGRGPRLDPGALRRGTVRLDGRPGVGGRVLPAPPRTGVDRPTDGRSRPDGVVQLCVTEPGGLVDLLRLGTRRRRRDFGRSSGTGHRRDLSRGDRGGDVLRAPVAAPVPPRPGGVAVEHQLPGPGGPHDRPSYRYCPRFDSVSIALLALLLFPVTSVRM
ncbi:hypothetical protein MFORT_01811 [Mycolicibacterium fortuitum subsp. fortuitum DSM 46621 = ATCC 6841 = JCM 6387]|uniref:Uncharacterized protein n=1 Tax=Mycolicibacterium fortuitum subsp. fortuitum DSM 46621 = ATCC 6841 = JCM 6387 TaxID=1214102 RepID=K0VA80_MYCFO|nr:hypothetical protein MFORT_01811 [Mycolicibacterium fortuitum subsp. fortuitum DSM 46621 = ATCC 6841 = JCM 6387]